MLSFFPRGVLDEILNLNLIESVCVGFPSYSIQSKVIVCLVAFEEMFDYESPGSTVKYSPWPFGIKSLCTY